VFEKQSRKGPKRASEAVLKNS